MARQSPNSRFVGDTVITDVPDVPGAPGLIQMFQQAVGQSPVYDPDAEAIQMALAERERIMAERGQSAPTYLPQGQTQGSLASVPHTAGYAGPTRASDLLFPMAQTPIMRPAAEQVLRSQPIVGAPGKTLGNIMDTTQALRGAPSDVISDVVRQQMGGQGSWGVGGGDMEALARFTEQAKRRGIPSHIIETQAKRMFPNLFPPSDLPVEKLSKLFKFNRETNTFQAAPSNLTDQQAREQGFRFYDEKQREAVTALNDIKESFQQMKSSVGDIQDKSAIDLFLSEKTGGNIGGPEGSVFRKNVINFTTVFDKFLGGVRAAASPQMQAIREKVLPQIYSTGEVSDTLMNQLEHLINTMAQTRIDTAVGVSTGVDTKAIDKQANQVLETFKQQGGVGQRGQGAPRQQTTPKGIPPGSVLIPGKIGPNGRPVYRAPNGRPVEAD